MTLRARLTLSGHDQENAFTIPATATSLNQHGAAIETNRKLPLNATVILQNSQGVQASVRVVAQVNAAQNVYTCGIEFVESRVGRDFWGVTFPPTI